VDGRMGDRDIDRSRYREIEQGAEISIDRDNEKSNREPRYRNIEKSIYRKGEKSLDQTINNNQ
jgi:hypothetical protein